MGYLKTVLTYDRPSEAEVDKSYLESQGIAVCLLNANTARNELGPAFYIQLQVNDGDLGKAVDLLRAANPARFGSPEKVAEIDRLMKRRVLAFAAAAIPAGLLAYWLISHAGSVAVPYYFDHVALKLRFLISLAIAVAVGIGSATIATRRSRPSP